MLVLEWLFYISVSLPADILRSVMRLSRDGRSVLSYSYQ